MIFAGVDVGAETIKYVLIEGKPLRVIQHGMVAHQKSVEPALRNVLSELKKLGVEKMAVCGRFANMLKIQNYPGQAVQKRGLTQLFGDAQLTAVTIGCNGFSVLEKRGGGADVYRENSRCSQGTGNFLRQLVERFDLDLVQSDEKCENVEKPCALSGRCPVILKTDMTHLANRGEDQANILAGVYDAICENVEALIKPSMCPKSIVLSGGVTRSARIRRNFDRFCEKNGLKMLEQTELSQFYIEAVGCACLAMECGGDAVPDASVELLNAECVRKFDEIPPLRTYLSQVKRLEQPPLKKVSKGMRVVLGFDIGSTGSKAVAIDAAGDEGLGDVCWEGYLRTNGNPVEAARQLMNDYLKETQNMPEIVAFGVTGSGREIVGSMLSTCYGDECVYILNEIAAHAEGARAIEPRVDTIFEIGGQDAKYIRLSDGRIVDAAMNEACSAGTGSFIEEQGRKFKEIESLSQLSELALSGDRGVSLGQHCSVFMTQVIEEAVAAGIETSAILAGIYDSVILNYFYRVKGNRSVGNVIFCQGMPFYTPALAAAVVRQTQAEVIIPPNPGTIGAFGIARLARKSSNGAVKTCDPALFTGAELVERNTFVCASNKGCGGGGNHCKIDRIVVRINGEKLQFTWGGACSLWDHGVSTKKLPNLTPDPFRLRNECVERIVARMPARGRETVAISDEFQLKTFFVFFASFLYELGFDLKVFKGGTLDDLRRGLDESNVRFCAPMQHYHGVAAKMAASDARYLFWPMMRSGRFSGQEEYAGICPVVQSSSDLLIHDLKVPASRVIDPVIDLGPGNLMSCAFRNSCMEMAKSLGKSEIFNKAFETACEIQRRFDEDLLAIGRQAMAFAKEHNLTTVVVLGRNYTIHNNALNSNVPALLRGQGAMAIPVDCYPIEDDEPLYSNVYWSYGQINLRAATQIRKTENQYAIWCSNYGCGPDSFNLHFFQFIMQGKPYTIIETDGHSGDAGTKTRIEAFLHCIQEYEQLPASSVVNDLHAVERLNTPIVDIRRKKGKLLIPPMGDNALVIAAGFRNAGIDCETLPVPTRESLLIGRRYTSGKECLPMLVTLGSLLEYVQKHPTNQKLVFFMPRSNGPCRLGCYNLLDKIVLKRLGIDRDVETWSLCDTDYSEGVSKATFVLIYAGFLACDALMAALYDVRPVESRPGAADVIYQRALKSLIDLIDNADLPEHWQGYVLNELISGRFFGITDIIKKAAREFAAVKTNKRVPTVCMTGEIYVRNDPFANDYLLKALESRGMRVMFAHFSEWIEYADIINKDILKTANTIPDIVMSHLVRHIIRAIHQPMAKALHWGTRHAVEQILDTASGYLRKDLVGEEILTIGTPLNAYRHGEIQGVVSVGPLECMPSKIAESQFYHVAENEGLLSLNLSFNGDPIPESVLDDFCFEVKRRFEEKQ